MRACPWLLVCPRRASPHRVSTRWTIRAPGVISARTRASLSPSFHQSCQTPASAVTVSPSPRTLVCPSRFTVSSPSSTVNRSTAAGWLVFSAARRASERVQFHDAAVIAVGVREFEDRRALAGDGVLPDLADLDRREIGWTVRVRMRHVPQHPGKAVKRYGSRAAAFGAKLVGCLVEVLDRLRGGSEGRGEPGHVTLLRGRDLLLRACRAAQPSQP